MAEQHGKALVPQIRFAGFTDPWEQRKLGELFEESDERASDREILSVSVANGIYPASESDRETNPGASLANYKIVHFGDVVYNSMRMWQGAVDASRYDGIVSPAYVVTRPNSEVYARFFARLLRQPMLLKQYQQVSQGNSKDTQVLKFDDFASIGISMPASENEQRQIGAFFDRLDSLITLHQRKYDKLQVLKKAMLEKMFPKNGSSVPEIRFKGFTDAWEQRKLGEVVKEVTRNDPTSEAPIMMITANNGFIEQSERYAFDNAGESLKKYILLQKGELAYNHGASKLRPFGSCFALTTAESARIPFVYHCFSAENQNAEFLSIELNGSEVESQLRKIVSSGARMDGLLNISFDEYSTVTVLLPDIKEQEHIADFFRNLDHLITLHQRELEKLQNIKKSMLEKMFV